MTCALAEAAEVRKFCTHMSFNYALAQRHFGARYEENKKD